MSNVAYKETLRYKVFYKYGGRCAYCGCELEFKKFHIDHIVPLMRGMRNCEAVRGNNTISNMNPSCYSCNIDKGTLSLSDWRYKLWNKIELLNKYLPNYRICKRFGFITENEPDLRFYFEKMGE